MSDGGMSRGLFDWLQIRVVPVGPEYRPLAEAMLGLADALRPVVEAFLPVGEALLAWAATLPDEVRKRLVEEAR